MQQTKPGQTTAYPRIIVAGTRGGSGKTTVSLGLIAAMRSDGLAVAPYKKGPDYIDAGWLSAAAGRPCYNLDPFFLDRQTIRRSFYSHYQSADCAVIEGNRGLYDGMDARGTCSTAELAKTLGSPVILVVDCAKATRTIGALVMGMLKFDHSVRVRGVVLNQVAGTRHERVIRDVIAQTTGIPVVGAVPKTADAVLSERHMGLTPSHEHPEVRRMLRAARQIARDHLDLESVLRIARTEHGATHAPARGAESGLTSRDGAGRVRIGIIRDSAFQFYYPENFEALKQRGARLVEISALTARDLPAVDALYIGGGFPETHAISLARNVGFRRALKRAVESGLPVYAECGGLMFLGDEIVLGGKRYPMTGVFPLAFSLEKRPQAHGYTIVEVTEENPYFKQGTVLRGHEFHYSRVVRLRLRSGMRFAYAMQRGEGIRSKKDGLCYKNALATYTHIHALAAPSWADGLIGRALCHRERKSNG